MNLRRIFCPYFEIHMWCKNILLSLSFHRNFDQTRPTNVRLIRIVFNSFENSSYTMAAHSGWYIILYMITTDVITSLYISRLRWISRCSCTCKSSPSSPIFWTHKPVSCYDISFLPQSKPITNTAGINKPHFHVLKLNYGQIDNEYKYMLRYMSVNDRSDVKK